MPISNHLVRFKARTWTPPSRAPNPTVLNGVFWHFASANGPFVVAPRIATTTARAHVIGGPGAWYASNYWEALAGELERYFLSNPIDLNLVVRRVGTVEVNLDVLDLTDKEVLKHLRLRRSHLAHDEWALAQTVALWARTDYQGLLLPSAAMEGATTLVVFCEGIQHVYVQQTAVVSGEQILTLGALVP